ncbi:superinfection immunity protein [Prosthecomicrobium hirschii]|uniref:superinfection immunity protein n=1 Tax=Prosthecodimorpha hirschii TaxID=665126 RepID=UPI003B8A9162
MEAVFLLLLGGFVALFFYLLPWYVAAVRRHRNIGGIAVVNVFLGWTFIGWVIALAWAASDPGTPRQNT